MDNNNVTHTTTFRIQNRPVAKQQSESSLDPNYQLPPPGGSSDNQAQQGSTFWRDMLNLPTPVDVKQEQHLTSITAANHVTNNVNNHVTSQAMVFHNNGSMHNNGFVNRFITSIAQPHPPNTTSMAPPPPSLSSPLCQLPMPLVFPGGGGSGQHPLHPPAPESPPPPRVYKPCSVCGDKSSGYHYGVCSCEGCKGFFRRSVQKSMEYVCHKEKQCIINKITRNRCQYCRLQKCYAKGMSREAVRNDRHKRRRSKEGEACSSSTQVSSDTGLKKDEEELIEHVLQAHQETFPLVVHDDDKFNTKDVASLSGMLWEKVRELSTHGIIQIVKFGKQVPGFTTLTTSDQITLLKAACLEILILRLSSRYSDDEARIEFSNGLQLSKSQLESGGFGTLTDTIFQFARCMQGYELDATEFAMLCAVCLLSGDRSGLEKADSVEKLQEPILEALKHYARQRRPTMPHVFAKMLMKLSDLRAISVKGAEKVLKLHSETSTELPPLIVEMLDRAENVSIPQ